MKKPVVNHSVMSTLLRCHARIGMATLLGSSIVLAGARALPLPNMIGTWNVTGTGAVLCKVQASRCKTHHHGEFSDLSAIATITEQKGRIFKGTFKSKYATEKFIGALSSDGLTVHIVDEDCFSDGRIVNSGTLQMIYRHTSDLDSVVDVSTWVRR